MSGLRAMAALLALATSAWRHPIHTTLTVVRPAQSGPGVEVRVRAFSDDFSKVVSRFAGRSAPADSSVAPSDALAYVTSRLELRDGSGSVIPMEPCGVQRQAEVTWTCLRLTSPPRGGLLRVRNELLTELHADQVNIVQVETGGARRSSRLFSRAAPLATFVLQ